LFHTGLTREPKAGTAFIRARLPSRRKFGVNADFEADNLVFGEVCGYSACGVVKLLSFARKRRTNDFSGL
jgi:hypothetical protein